MEELLRMAWADESKGDFKEENAKLIEPFRNQSFKFGNGMALYGLQPGERLLGLVLQEGIWKKFFLGKGFQVRPPVLVALTDKQLILLEEEPLNIEANYGWIFTYCSRSIIQQIEIRYGKKAGSLFIFLNRNGVEMTLQTRLRTEASQKLIELWQALETQENEF